MSRSEPFGLGPILGQVSARRTASGYRACMPREGTGPDFIEALARGLEVIAAFAPRPAADDAGRGGRRDRAGPPDRPPDPAHPAGAGLRPRSTAPASRSPRGCSSWAWPTCARWASGRSPGRTWKRLSPGPGSPARSPSSTAPDIVYVARVAVPKIVALAVQIGTRFPALQTSLGKVLLAALDPAELDAVLAEPTRSGLVPALAARPRRAGRRAARGPGPRLGADRRAAGPGHPVGRGPAARRGGPGDRRAERQRARRGDPGRAAARSTTCRCCCRRPATISADFARLQSVPHVTRTPLRPS